MLVSCSWCHEINDVSTHRYCGNCGHQAGVPRAECNCDYCNASYRGFRRNFEKDRDELEEQRSRMRDV